MKLRQILTTLAVLAGLFIILVNWHICLPGGCVFDYRIQTCEDGNCLNEDVGSHLQERLSFLTVITSSGPILGSLLILSVAFFILFNNKTSLLICRYRFRTILKYFFLDYNSFNFLFAKGVLHPKIY